MKKLKSYQYERYALLCQASYPTDFDHTAYGFNTEGHCLIRDLSGQVSIRVMWGEKREVVVVFRGTYHLTDWLTNLALFPVKRTYPGASYRVHWGYSRLLEQPSPLAKYATEPSLLPPTPPGSQIVPRDHAEKERNVSVYERLQQVLEPLIADGKRITLTGHSSGGSMAILAADRLERRYPTKVKRVITFGQPGTGTWSFKKQYLLHKRTYRICCDIDIVTFLPPIPGLYWHVGRMLWLHNDKIYENVSEHFRLVKSLTSWLMMPISYHDMGKYIRRKDFFDKH
ncbi:lipase family protein [Corallincola spongiicola]|uniref:DUF2974 domain-containing protein n=1 Tax=Corallincola spongiicola TaxID=2520508 RepID=A0ABY1WSS0_9GAMM|nr:Mbeg1-like protein [Corallincola spongiicola]TAA47799.1 DUF2974 domain-containing protein [Corallincola spongiicola]